MKKFLSLVMALALTVSLVTVSAGAKDFTDKSSISYKEAVDVISSLGVVDGYTDGTFNPSATLTRGAAAKIICNLILGPSTASALGVNAAPFKDVPVSNVFAGYIAYCSQQGIINGYADGTFKPAATVTGYQFMKMLLGALGYDGSIEGFTGSNWTVAVAKLAVSLGLDDGNDSFVGSKAMTREEAALYSLNTLKATEVKYDTKGTQIQIGDTTISAGASTAKKVEAVVDTNTIKSDGYVQFAEEHFSKLKLTSATTDDFGRPANTWKNGATKIGTYAKTADATYTAEVKIGTIYSDLGLSSTVIASHVTAYVDGAATTAYALSKGDTTNKYGANGVITEVFYDDDTDTATVVLINTYVGKVSSVTAATATADRYVTITGLNPSESLTYETDSFAKKDVVLYTKVGTTVESVTAAPSVTGSFTAYSGTSSVVVGGTTYKASAKATGIGSSYIGGTQGLKDSVVTYLDNAGYAIYMVQDTAATEGNIAFVLDAQAASGAFVKNQVQLVNSDGTVSIVSAKANYTGLINHVVRYSVSDSVYTLTDLATADADATLDLTKNTSKFTYTDSTNASATAYANSSTIFVVANGTDPETYTVYTGIANVPSLSADAADNTKTSIVGVYCKDAGSVATFVFAKNLDSITDNTTNKIFVAYASKEATTDSNGTYYTYNAVVNGDLTTLKLSNDLAANTSATSITYDSHGIGTLAGTVAAMTPQATGTEATSGSVIGLGSEYYSYASDVSVYYISSKGVITVSDIDAVTTDANDTVYYTVKDNTTDVMQNLFITSIDNTYSVSAGAIVNGVTASVSPATAAYGSSVTVTMSGTATATGTMSVLLNGSVIYTYAVTATGDGAASTSFSMPAQAANVTLSFTAA